MDVQLKGDQGVGGAVGGVGGRSLGRLKTVISLASTVSGLQILQYVSDRPPDLEELPTASLQEGNSLVHTTLDDWEDGANRFDQPGEAFLLAMLDDAIVGICGLNIDPYSDDPKLSRIRHLYVLPDHRRQHVGRRLVEACLARAEDVFDRVRLRTFDSVAAQFYESIGFEEYDEEHATHSITPMPYTINLRD
jgi:GNAT superfamily N-acetyltransferase